MSKHSFDKLFACLTILVMASVAGTAAGFPQPYQANEEYEAACMPLPVPPGWSEPAAGDPEAEAADAAYLCEGCFVGGANHERSTQRRLRAVASRPV